MTIFSQPVIQNLRNILPVIIKTVINDMFVINNVEVQH